MFYLQESHPREFLVALQGVPKVVLQGPELSVQIVVDWDGTGKKREDFKNGCMRMVMLKWI